MHKHHLAPRRRHGHRYAAAAADASTAAAAAAAASHGRAAATSAPLAELPHAHARRDAWLVLRLLAQRLRREDVTVVGTPRHHVDPNRERFRAAVRIEARLVRFEAGGFGREELRVEELGQSATPVPHASRAVVRARQ